MALSCAFCLVKWGIFIGVFVFLIHFWISSKSYLLSEEEVAGIATPFAGAGANVEQAFDKIHQEFLKKYPGHILPKEDLQWIFFNAGGWMASMCVIHASVTEYVMFFGTALECTGHSGRYWANVTDTILTGEFQKWPEGALKVEVYKPGDTVTHVWGEATGINFKSGTWAVEYGRGFIPSTLSVPLTNTIFSTQDFLTMFYMFKVLGKTMILEAGYYLSHTSEIFG